MQVSSSPPTPACQELDTRSADTWRSWTSYSAPIPRTTPSSTVSTGCSVLVHAPTRPRPQAINVSFRSTTEGGSGRQLHSHPAAQGSIRPQLGLDRARRASELARQIGNLRTTAGLTQKELAERMGSSQSVTSGVGSARMNQRGLALLLGATLWCKAARGLGSARHGRVGTAVTRAEERRGGGS